MKHEEVKGDLIELSFDATVVLLDRAKRKLTKQPIDVDKILANSPCAELLESALASDEQLGQFHSAFPSRISYRDHRRARKKTKELAINPKHITDINTAYSELGVVVKKTTHSLFAVDIESTRGKRTHQKQEKGKLVNSLLLLSFNLASNPIGLIAEYNNQLVGSQKCISMNELMVCVGCLLGSEIEYGLSTYEFLFYEKADTKFINDFIGYIREYNYVFTK